MAKKNKCPDCPSIPGWMTTFSDLMSLLLTFFILLLSFSSVQESKFQQARGSLLAAFGLLTHGGDTVVETPLDKYIPEPPDEAYNDEEVLEELNEEIEKSLKAMNFQEALPKNLLKLELTEKGLHILISDSLFFDSGKSLIKEDFKHLLLAIGKVIASNSDKYSINIEGHTDDTPINTVRYPSNWELSSDRAINVLKFMINEFAIPPEKISATGYGEYRPIASNKTKKGRARNRRVEIYLDQTLKKH